MIGFIGATPTPVNGAGNFWSSAPTTNLATIAADNLKIPQFYAGAIIAFSQYQTWVAAHRYSRPGRPGGAGAIVPVDDVAVNSNASFNGTSAYSIFSPLVNPLHYFDNGTELINLRDKNALPFIDWVLATTYVVDDSGIGIFTGKYAISDTAPNLHGGSDGPIYGFVSETASTTQFDLGGIIANTAPGDNNATNPFLGILANNYALLYVNPFGNPLVDGESYGIEITPTAFVGYRSGSQVGSLARTVSNSVSGGTLGNGGSYLANASNTIDTTGLAPGIYNLTATSSDSQTTTVQFQILPPLPVIDNTTPSAGETGVAYTHTFTATSGTAPYVSWVVTVGSLPPGLTLNPATGVLSGTPTGSGDYTFTIEVTDSAASTDTQSFTMHISGDVSLTNSPLSGTCWANTETLNFTINSGTITAISSLTAGVTGTTGGLGTANATFTLSHTYTTTSATIRVTEDTGDFEDFAITLCPMLPIITNTIDDPNVTTDDAANLPPSSIYQCVGVSVDVSGPGFLTGDVTWDVLDSLNVPLPSGVTITGQNTEQITFSIDDTVPAGNYTLRARETANLTNQSLHPFTLIALPSVTVGAPNQPYVTGQTQFATTFPFPVTWSPAEVNASGLATWATSGVKTVSYTPVSSACAKTFSYTVYDLIDVAEYDGTNCVYINSGETLALTVTGGSGSYEFQITGQNSISAAGVITAGIYAGEYTVSVIDATANLIYSFPVCIGTQSQFCVGVETTACTDADQAEPCCELSVECGETVTLKVPSFHMRVNGRQEDISYSSYSTGSIDEGGYFKSGSSISDAFGNKVKCSDSESMFEIITNVDMADTTNAPFGIGFSKVDATTGGTSTIDIAVVWHTVSSTRYIEVRKNGSAMSGSTFAVLQGDVISAGYKDGKFVVYINNLLRFETTDFECCGEQYLDVSIEEPNKSIGGNLSGLTWTIATPGTVSEVGTINASGVYSSPLSGNFSIVEAQATVGNATFRVRIRNIKPTEKRTSPKAFLAGKSVTLWVGPYIPNMNEAIRLAKDGSPDANQNGKMIDCGTLEGSANFQEQMEYQDFENDNGQIYHTALIKETAQLTATFLEVRDLYKMSVLKPESTLHAKNRGVREFSVGGKACDLKELRAILVIGSPECDDTFDVLYLPRVQNKGNLGLELGKKTNGKYEITLTVLPDYTRPAGKQLYSIYQIDSCGSASCS